MGDHVSSDEERQTPAGTCLKRRRFLRSAGLLCGAMGSLYGLGARAQVLADAPLAPSTGGPRRLNFVHTHTGETLSAAYFDGSAYDETCLGEINHLLRDFRTGESHVIDPPLLDILYELQARADVDAPFEIISGYRSPATNAMLHRRSSGVAEHSQHLLGKAIDVRLSGYSTRSLGEHARALSRGGVGFYARSDFVHVDTGPVRFW
jgi:uncharacterized protein YcbK (DUF882 family)